MKSQGSGGRQRAMRNDSRREQTRQALRSVEDKLAEVQRLLLRNRLEASTRGSMPLIDPEKASSRPSIRTDSPCPMKRWGSCSSGRLKSTRMVSSRRASVRSRKNSITSRLPAPGRSGYPSIHSFGALSDYLRTERAHALLRGPDRDLPSL